VSNAHGISKEQLLRRNELANKSQVQLFLHPVDIAKRLNITPKSTGSCPTIAIVRIAVRSMNTAPKILFVIESSLFWVATNVQGLLLWRHSLLVQPRNAAE
jgi:hypothetical protein